MGITYCISDLVPAVLFRVSAVIVLFLLNRWLMALIFTVRTLIQVNIHIYFSNFEPIYRKTAW